MYTILFVFYVISTNSTSATSQQIGRFPDAATCNSVASQLAETHKPVQNPDSYYPVIITIYSRCVYIGAAK